MAKEVISVRVDKEIKEEVEKILNELGLNLSTAVNAFLRAILRERGLPFPLKLEQIPGTVGIHRLNKFPKKLEKALEDLEKGEIEDLDFSKLK